MPSQKLIQVGLWIANAAVALAIVVLSLVWFVFSKPPSALAGLSVVTAPRRGPVTGPADTGTDARLRVAAGLPNPLEPPAAPVTAPTEPPLSQLFAVSSTSAPYFATIVLKNTQFSFSARLEEILSAAKLPANIPQREYLTGWKVIEIQGYPDQAVVLERDGKRETLMKKDSAMAAGGVVSPTGPAVPTAAADLARYRGQPYNGAQYRTYQRGATWFVDPEEINWAIANQATILQSDVRLSPSEGGGVRVDYLRSGSVLEARGLQTGDIITELNRRRIEGPAQVSELMQWLTGESPQQVYIRINRAGRAIVLVYRPAPREGQ